MQSRKLDESQTFFFFILGIQQVAHNALGVKTTMWAWSTLY